jgi:predicted lipid-binding transport protein (Tim44 family)
MDPKLDFTTLFFLAMAVIVFLKLRSVLGRRTGEDAQRYERYKAEQQARAQAQQQRNDNIVTLPRRDKDQAPQTVEARESAAERDAKMTKFAGNDQALAAGLQAVGRADPSFDPAHFMTGAKAAYEMIVMAFAEGNRSLLKDLLAPEVYEGFVAALTDREGRGERVEQSFVGISAATMQEAELRGPETQITVKFVSELISATRSAAGEVVAGDPKKIKEVTDVWTFAQDTAANDPNWRVVATQAAA